MPPTDRYLPTPTFLPCIPVKTEPSLKGTINTGVKRLLYSRVNPFGICDTSSESPFLFLFCHLKTICHHRPTRLTGTHGFKNFMNVADCYKCSPLQTAISAVRIAIQTNYEPSQLMKSNRNSNVDATILVLSS